MRVLFDASIFIHANFHILKKFVEGPIDSKELGKRVVNQIESICLDKFEGYDVVLALEGGDNFRKKLSSEYKASRTTPDIDFEIVEHTLRGSFRCIKKRGLEADDVAFVYSRIYPDCVLVSEDNDYYLMLDEQRAVYKYKQKKMIRRCKDTHLMECILKVCHGCDSDEIPKIKLKRFGPSFIMKFIRENKLNLKDSLDVLEAMDYISDWSLNYDLAMYDLETYIKYLGQEPIQKLVELCQQ